MAATKDLLGWLNDPRPYNRGFHNGSWESCENDFSLAVDALSPSLRTLLDTPARAVETAVSSLRNRRSDIPERTRIAVLCEQLLVDLESPSALIACWRDLTAACQDINRPKTELDILRDTFWDCLKLRDAATGSFGVGSRLMYVLRDNQQEIGAIRARLDNTEQPTSDIASIRRKAGLSADDRLELCERVLAADPDLADNVVWLRIRDASLNGVTADYGVVQLYDSQWLHGNLFGESRPYFDTLPTELRDSRNYPSEHDFPDEANWVLRLASILAMGQAGLLCHGRNASWKH